MWGLDAARELEGGVDVVFLLRDNAVVDAAGQANLWGDWKLGKPLDQLDGNCVLAFLNDDLVTTLLIDVNNAIVAGYLGLERLGFP